MMNIPVRCSCSAVIPSPWRINPDEHWNGLTGFVHQAIFDNYLKTHPYPEDIEYYICGPPMMLQAVLKMLDSLGVDPDMIHYDDFGG